MAADRLHRVLVAGVPALASSVASKLSAHHPIDDLSAVRGVDLLGVLHGDNVRGRVQALTGLISLGLADKAPQRAWNRIYPARLAITCVDLRHHWG